MELFGFVNLSEEGRAMVKEILKDSLSDEDAEPLFISEAIMDEVDRRDALCDADPSRMISYEDFKARRLVR